MTSGSVSTGRSAEAAAPTPLLGGPALAIVVASLLAGAWLEQTVLVFVAGAILALIGVSRGWGRLAMTRLVYSRGLDITRAFPGERIALTLRLENRKILPVAWARVVERLPPALAPADESPGLDPAVDAAALRRTASLLWYRRAVWRSRLDCRRRGVYEIGPALVETGDAFGLFPRAKEVAGCQRIVVYPRLLDLGAVVLPARAPLGDTRAAASLFADPSRTAGVRPYGPEVPFKHIHWKASVRAGALQARYFEPATTQQTLIFLDLDGYAGAERDPAGEFEHAVSIAGSLARDLVTGRNPVGLYVNGAGIDGGGPVRRPPALGTAQLMAILEDLAAVEARPRLPFAAFLDSCEGRLALGATLVLITTRLSPGMRDHLRALERAGFRAAVLQTGPNPAPTEPLRAVRLGAADGRRAASR